MTKDLRDHRERFPGGQQGHGRGVPESVRVDPYEPGPLGQLLQHVVHGPRVQEGADGAGEHHILITPADGGQPFGGLALPMLPERVHDERRKRDGTL